MMLGEIGRYHVWDFPAAEAAFRRAIELNPRDAYAQAGYADVLRITGRGGLATIEIARALTLEPNDAKLRRRQALHFYDDGQCAEVIREADQASTMRPNLTMAFRMKGLCYESTRDWAAAERELKAALAIAPEDPRALPAIGRAGRRMAGSRFRRARSEHAVCGRGAAIISATRRSALEDSAGKAARRVLVLGHGSAPSGWRRPERAEPTKRVAEVTCGMIRRGSSFNRRGSTKTGCFAKEGVVS
jgi:tetratricopeptide (TPR) repeat protein